MNLSWRYLLSIFVLLVFCGTSAAAQSTGRYPIKIVGESYFLALFNDGTVTGWGRFADG